VRRCRCRARGGGRGKSRLCVVRCSTPSELWSWVTGRPAPGATPARPPRPGRRSPQPVRKYNCLSTSLQHMRPSHGAMGLRWRMAMRCYVIAGLFGSRERGWSIRASGAGSRDCRDDRMGDARVRRSGCFPVPRRVAVSKLVTKHRLSYYCDIYAPDVPVDGMFSVRR
jgi:hypothetical protein